MSAVEPGSGMVTPGGGLLGAVVVIVLVAALALAWRRVPPGLMRQVVLAVGTAAIVAYVAVGQMEAIGRFDEFGGAYYPGPVASVHPESLEADATVVDARPNEPFRLTITVTNAGLVPITIRGIASLQMPELGPRFVGARLLKEPNVLDVSDAATVAFRSVGLAPGGRVDIVAVVDPGPCVATGPAGGWTPIPSIPLVYDVLGWERTLAFELPEPPVILRPASCP